MSAILSQMFLPAMGLSSRPRALYLLRAIALHLQAVSLVTLLSPLPHPGLYLPGLVVFVPDVMLDCADPVFSLSLSKIKYPV